MNHSINQTAMALSGPIDIGTASQIFFTVLIPEILRRLFVFVAAPFIYLDMWWLLVHLLLTFVLFEFYFERHKDEELGWTSALANSIVMMFISLELLRQLYHHRYNPFQNLWVILKDYIQLGLFHEQMIVVSLIGILFILGITTAVVNYFHLGHRKLAYLFSSHKFTNLLAYFLMVVVWSFDSGKRIPIDWITVISVILFGSLCGSLLHLINKGTKKKIKVKKQYMFGE